MKFERKYEGECKKRREESMAAIIAWRRGNEQINKQNRIKQKDEKRWSLGTAQRKLKLKLKLIEYDDFTHGNEMKKKMRMMMKWKWEAVLISCNEE